MVRFSKIQGVLLAMVLLLTACKEELPKKDGNAGIEIPNCRSGLFEENRAGYSRKSQLFRVDTACGERVAAIRSIVGGDTLERFFVLRDSAAYEAGRKLPAELTGSMVLRTPLKRVVALSSSHIGYMLRLGVDNRIVAVGDGKYIADSALYARTAARGIAQVGNGTFLDIEKIITLKPDLVMTFATGGSQDDYDRMEKLGIPVMLTSEWQETTLEGKTSWLKLFGALFGVDVQAALSDSMEMDYLDPCVVRTEPYDDDRGNRGELYIERGPRILAGMSYGGVWYAPGGKSVTADLIRRAGGCYLWASDTTRELRLTLEDIIALADSVDIWVNPGMFGSPEEILASEPRVASIKAFKNKLVFQNDGRKGPGGGNDFFESAVARPLELEKNLSELFEKSYRSLNAVHLIQCSKHIHGPKQGKKLYSVDTLPKWYHNIF